MEAAGAIRKAMKILLVNKFLYKRGGSETYFLSLSESLEKAGHTVYLFGMNDERNENRPESKYYIDNIDYSKKTNVLSQIKQGLKSIYSFEAKHKFEALIREYKPDIVHINLIHRQITLSILDVCEKYNIPVVFTTHDLVCSCPVGSLLTPTGETCRKCYGGHYINCVKNKCIKNSTAKSIIAFIEESFYKIHKSYNKIDAYISPSKFYQNEILKSNITNNQVYHLTNFLQVNTEYSSHDSKNFYLFLGSLTKNKGVMTILKAFHKANIENFKLVLAGNGPEQEALNEYIQTNGLEEKVLLPGFVSGEELAKLKKEAYIVIMASEWYENCPYGLMEPMAYGKPIIGSKIGGIPELAIDGITGWTFESKNINELSDLFVKTSRLSSDEYASLSKSTLDFAKEKFDSHNYVKQLESIYTDLIEGKQK